MFSTNFNKIGCSFAETKFFEKSKMADMLYIHTYIHMVYLDTVKNHQCYIS